MSRRPDPLVRALRRPAPLPRPQRGVDPTRAGSLADDTGAATAEFAIVTMAAVGFAGLLVVILRSDEVRGILTDLVRDALAFAG
jgi:hypothetical protein